MERIWVRRSGITGAESGTAWRSSGRSVLAILGIVYVDERDPKRDFFFLAPTKMSNVSNKAEEGAGTSEVTQLVEVSSPYCPQRVWARIDAFSAKAIPASSRLEQLPVELISVVFDHLYARHEKNKWEPLSKDPISKSLPLRSEQFVQETPIHHAQPLRRVLRDDRRNAVHRRERSRARSGGER